MDIAAWLKSLGLEEYEHAFRENAIDGDVLPKLTAEDLKDLGITAVGHRRKLLDAIAVLRAPAPKIDIRKPIAAEAERRQVTVLFADLVGYTRLSQTLDAEEMHALLEHFFSCVDHLIVEHGGSVDKHIGDCVMAVFGAPVAHGNDAERGVRAALAIRQAMPEVSAEAGHELRVHIGVAGGQVVASGGGSASHREYTVTGGSVNLAARLTDAAGPGEILVSDRVWQALAERLDGSDAGLLDVAGFKTPVRAWRLTGLRDRLHSRPLVGRDAEMEQLLAGLKTCRESGRGRAFCIRGEAGIGKTRLLEEFLTVARRQGFACHLGLVLDFGTGTGRDASRSLVRGILGLEPDSSEEAAQRAADAALAAGVIAAEATVFLNDLIGLPQPVELRALYDAMDNATRTRGKRETIVEIAERASRRQPRVLAVEDVHWADAVTLANLASLAAMVADCPTILVMTSRVEQDPIGQAWRAQAGGSPLVIIDLGPLRAEDAQRLAAPFFAIPRLRENPKTPLAKRRDPDSTERMIRPGFLDIELRQNLIELARDGLAAHRLARRANALVLLDDGMSCEAIAKVLLLDDDTIRTWYRLYEGDGIEGLTNFSYEGSACQLSGEQQEKLKAWVATALPRTTRQVGAWIENEFGVVYEGRSGLIALLHRLGLEYHKPNVIPRKLDEEKQRAFIEGYEKLLNSLGDDEAVLFADAVHPTHAARPVGCWAPSQEKLAIEQTSGRQRINIHGAIDLETGQTRMIEALTIDAASTIRLLQSIEALYPMLALIHVFLDNARYHHAKLVQEWLALPGRRIKLHFIPTYCPHLNPIERLWGLMHRNVTHNKCYATCAQFADATLSFLREKVPGNWADLCDSVTDNFRIINPKDFRVMT